MNNQLEDIDNEYYEIDVIEDNNENDGDDYNDIVYDDFYKQVKVELSLSEFNRKSFTFNYKGEILKGVPIHELDKNNIIFDINKKLKKIKLDLVEID